jgi:uncharacterized protein
MQYVVHAYDFTDDEALTRRMAVRPAHFTGVRRLKAAGQFLLSGALLNDTGRMIGSLMVLDFATDADLQAWLQHEPYITGRVWDRNRIEINPFRPATL